MTSPLSRAFLRSLFRGDIVPTQRVITRAQAEELVDAYREINIREAAARQSIARTFIVAEDLVPFAAVQQWTEARAQRRRKQ